MAKRKQDLYPQLPPGSEPYNGYTEQGFPVSKRNVPAYGFDEDGKPVHAYNDKGEPVCGRKINGENRICQSTIVDDTGRCAALGHGGGPHRGGAPISSGLRSKALKGLKLGQKHLEALRDRDLVTHENNKALCELFLSETLAGALPPIEIWERCLDLYEKGVDRKDVGALLELGEALRTGVSNAERFDKAVEYMAEQRKHQEAADKRSAQLQLNMSVREANAFTAALATALMDGFADLQSRLERNNGKLTVRDLIQVRSEIGHKAVRQMSR